MIFRAIGWVCDLVSVVSDAGTLDGSKETRVSRAWRLLFMTDDAGVRLVAPTVTLWYISWFVILESESAVWLVG